MRTLCRLTLSLAGVLASITGYALQEGTAANGYVQAPVEPIVSPLFIEKKVQNPDPLSKEKGWQVGGLNTRFSSNLGKSVLNFSGGVFYSREVAANQYGTNNSSSSNLMGLNGIGTANSSMLGFAGNFLTNNSTGKSDQILFQRMQYQVGGLSMSGSYSNVGQDFQGMGDLTKGMNSDDAKLLGLGMSQTNFGLSYNGIRGMQFSTNRSTVGNNKDGDKENGLTRTTQTSSIGMALGQQHRLEYSLGSTLEEWDPAVVRNDTREVHTQLWRLSGNVGKKSNYSLTQSTADTNVGGKDTAGSLQRGVALNWSDWSAVTLSGGYTDTLNTLTKENNNILNLATNVSLGPRFQLAGKFVDNTTTRPGATQNIENDLLDFRLTSKVAHNLQLTSGYNTNDNPDKGKVSTTDNVINWAPSSTWNMTSHFQQVDSDRDGTAAISEHTAIGTVGSKASAAQVTLFTRSEELMNQTQQDRHEVTYTRALPAGGAAKVLLQTGMYARETPSTKQDSDLLAVQVLNVSAGDDTTLSVGYYDGPRLGAGYLNYRTWGQKNSNNLGVWGDQDFAGYSETGGEVVHTLSPSTKVSVRRMHGALEDSSTQDMVEYGIEQHIGIATVQGRKACIESSAKGSNRKRDNFDSWKVTIPGGKPLPEWAANSIRASVFDDSANWGLGRLPSWQISQPVNGLSVEKRQSPDASKPVDQYIVQGASMLSRSVFAQASYESNPLKSDPNSNTTESVRRSLFHIGYEIRPQVQMFGRYIYEENRDQASIQNTVSLGFVGKLSPIERLQLQINTQTRSVSDKSLNGNAYSFEYERKVASDDYLLMKMQVNPEEFSDANNRLHLEVGYNHTF